MKKIFVLFASCMLALTIIGHAGNPNTNNYPLKTCVVSGDDLDKPYIFTYKGQTVELCCKRCAKEFYANPDKYLKKIQAAQKAKTN